MTVGKHSFFLLGGGSERRHTSTFSLCAYPSLKGALLQTVVSDGFSLSHNLSCPGDGLTLLKCLCMRVVAYNVLSAQSANSLCDGTHEVDAYVIGLTGTRFHFYPRVAQRTALPSLTMSDISGQDGVTSRRDARTCRPECQFSLPRSSGGQSTW